MLRQRAARTPGAAGLNAVPRQQKQKVGGLCSEAAADFHANNDARAAAGAFELEISLAALAACGGVEAPPLAARCPSQ